MGVEPEGLRTRWEDIQIGGYTKGEEKQTVVEPEGLRTRWEEIQIE